MAKKLVVRKKKRFGKSISSENLSFYITTAEQKGYIIFKNHGKIIVFELTNEGENQ